MTNKELFQSYTEDIKQKDAAKISDEARKLKLVEDWKNKMYLDFGFLVDIGFTMRFMTTYGHRYDACIISIYRENDGWNCQHNGYALVHDFDDLDIETLKGMYHTDWTELETSRNFIDAEFDTLKKIQGRIKTISKEDLIRRFAIWYNRKEE